MGKMDAGEFKRLREAAESNRRDMQPFIEKMRDNVLQYAGPHYGGGNDVRALPLNMLRMFTQTHLRLMTARDPKPTVTTEFRELNSTSEKLERALEYQVKRINLKTVMRRINQDGILGQGFAKIGLRATREVDYDGEETFLPEPFVARVALEDMICDLSAKDWESQQFVGHRYVMPVSEMRRRFKPTEEETKKWQEEHGFQHDELGNERLSTISNSKTGNIKFFEPVVELAEIYVKKTGNCITYPIVEEARVLDERSFYGPTEGPLERINFGEVNGQVLPLPPVTLIRDLHDALNYVYRKCIDQAGRQKTLFGVRGNAQKDIERQMKARDGYAVKLDSPQGVVPLNFPGVSRESLVFVADAMARLNMMGGNLELLAGTGSQTDTFGQEQILAAGANKLAEEMADASYSLGRWCMRGIGMYLWEDETVELPLSHRIPGSNFEIKSVWNPEQRRGEFLDRIRVDGAAVEHRQVPNLDAVPRTDRDAADGSVGGQRRDAGRGTRRETRR
jgi:hypothetical protein